MATYSLWQSNGGCTACDELEGYYIQPPARPHPHCLCTIQTVEASDIPGLCVWDEPMIVSTSADSQDVDYHYDEERQQYVYTRITWSIEFEVLCRDASLVTVELAYEDEDPLITDGLNLDDLVTYMEMVIAELEQQALDQAACPGCDEQLVRW